jgi:hypothetical protein
VLTGNFILSRFLSNIKKGKIKNPGFDEVTIENLKLIADMLKGLK